MKRVLCLIDRLGYGGAERQIIGLTILLKKNNYIVDLATYYSYDYPVGSLESEGICIYQLRPSGNPISKVLAVRRLVRQNGYDTMIAYKTGAEMLACFLKIIGVKVNVIVSERNTTQTLNARERIKFFLFRWADCIVPNSITQSLFIQNHYPSLANKTKTITNYTDLNCFSKKETPQNELITVLTVARIAKQKNVKAFLQVVKRLKDAGDRARFVWFGNVQTGQEEYGKQCQTMRTEFGIDDVFEFFPATTNILKEYQSCDIFCLPSCYEGYPNVICEAMCCGKPIICSNVCDNPFIVEDKVNGFLFNPNDINDMYEKMHQLINIPQLQRNEMGDKSRSIAENKFSDKLFVYNYIELIEAKSRK